MRYLMLTVSLTAALAAVALGIYGPTALGEAGWLASALGWLLALGAGLATLAETGAPRARRSQDRRPA